MCVEIVDCVGDVGFVIVSCEGDGDMWIYDWLVMYWCVVLFVVE